MKMIVYKSEEIVKLNEISELFSYLFVSVDNDTFITFHDNFEYLLISNLQKFILKEISFLKQMIS